MACESPFDGFRVATESLSQDVYVLASYKSIFMNLVPRGVFVRGQGVVRSTFTVGRSEPTTDEPSFTAVTTAQGHGNDFVAACNVTYNDVPVGFREATFGPEVFGWRGPILCEDKLMFDFNVEAFIPLYIRAISKNTEQTISNRLASIYTSFVPKAVANTDFHFVDGDISIHPPTSPDLTLDESFCMLDQDMLDETADILNDAGASDIDTDGWIDLRDGPMYTLYIGATASNQLMLENSELVTILAFADMGEGDGAKLLSRVGANKVLKNFRHVINLRPPRYYYDTDHYVRVPSRIADPTATKGTMTIANPAWVSTTTAPFEGCWVLTPWVFTDEIVEPVSAVGGVAFTPKNHVGVFDFIVGGKEISVTDCYDPRKKLGAHFAEYWHAPRPIYPLYGRFIIFKRCPRSFTCNNCS